MRVGVWTTKFAKERESLSRSSCPFACSVVQDSVPSGASYVKHYLAWVAPETRAASIICKPLLACIYN